MADSVSLANLDAPASSSTVRVRMIDSTAYMSLQAKIFIEPVPSGHETMNMSDVIFLIENEKLGKKALFDLGVRKDLWNYPPAVQKRFDLIATGIKVEKDVRDILEQTNIPLSSINDIIWSHAHFDHVGDTTLFPSTTNLVYGPEISSMKHAYPSDPESMLRNDLFEGRKNIEISFPPDGLMVGGFPAHDFYGDGSFYLLETPGHAKGHLCGLARTTPDTFIFMGGDVCHFPGDLRPNAAYPFPDPVPADVLDKDSRFPTPCPGSFFLDDHPQFSSSQQQNQPGTNLANTDDTPLIASKEAKRAATIQQHLQTPTQTQTPSTTPFYTLPTHSFTAYSTPSTAVAKSTIHTLTANFDAAPNVLVALAHDPALLDHLPCLNTCSAADATSADLNDWQARGWKEKCYWGWLNHVARKGTPGRPVLVDGWYRDGKRFDTATEMIAAGGGLE